MDKQLKQVEEFHRKHGFPVGVDFQIIQDVQVQQELENVSECAVADAKLLIGSPCIAAQRASLILEEAGEIGIALANHDMVELADGLADLMYVVLGTAVAYSIPLEKLFDEVHRSNMTKNVCNEPLLKGSVSKGEGYSPPDIAGILSADGLV